MDLVCLGDDERCHPCDFYVDLSPVCRVQRCDCHRVVVDKHGLKANGSSRNSAPVCSEPGRPAPGAAGSRGLWNDEVNGNQHPLPSTVVNLPPTPGFRTVLAFHHLEPRVAHHRRQLRLVREQGWVEREVAVRCIRSDGEVAHSCA